MNLKKLHGAMLVCTLFWGVTAQSGSGDDEAGQWLERMIKASQTLNYEGTFVYVQGQTVEAMHIVHSSGNDGERQRLVSLNGSIREVLVVDNHVVCLLPKQKVTFSGADYNRSPFPISLPDELSRLEKYYRFQMLGDDRVANVHTHVIAIQPRDQYRFGYHLWLDSETGMVLRSVLLNERGHILEQLMFTSVELKPKIDVKLLLPQDPQRAALTPAEQKGEPVTESNWVFQNLPEGFVEVLHNRYTKSPNHATEHILFTDGLATVSVFLERLNGAEPLLVGASQMGAMHAYGAVKHEHQVMAVGEVPAVTVELIVKALEYKREAAKHD
jgi:sigma-E factor negative regulatory protein RseB